MKTIIIILLILFAACASDPATPVDPHMVGDCNGSAWNARIPQIPGANFESCEAACEAPLTGSAADFRYCWARAGEGSGATVIELPANLSEDGLWGYCPIRTQMIGSNPPTTLADVSFDECIIQPPPTCAKDDYTCLGPKP